MSERIVRPPEAEVKTGYSHSTIKRLVRAGKFPKPIRLAGGRAKGWLESTLDQYLKQLANDGGER
jgi:prophage regulatory protein